MAAPSSDAVARNKLEEDSSASAGTSSNDGAPKSDPSSGYSDEAIASMTAPPPLSKLRSDLATLNYDLFLDHTAHLYCSTFILERVIERHKHIKRPRVSFVDPFATQMQIDLAPYQLLADTLDQLHPYIPQHLKEWCRIGFKSVGEGTNAAASVATDLNQDHLVLQHLEPITDAHLHQTLVQARLVNHASSLNLLPTAASSIVASSTSSAVVAPSSSSTTRRSLVAYGELSVVIRYPSSNCAVPLSTDVRMIDGIPSVRSHTLTLQVYGLDPISTVLARISSYAFSALGFEIATSTAFAVKRSFTVPLSHFSSSDRASQLTRLSSQQTIFSAQLHEHVLLVEVDTLIAIPNQLHLTLRTIDGQTLDVDCNPSATVAELKQIITRRPQYRHYAPSHLSVLLRETKLDDTRTLQSYGVTQNSHLVLLQRTNPTSASSSSSIGDFTCGRAHVNSLSSASPKTTQLLHSLMSCHIPSSSQLQSMSSESLIDLLLTSRTLLSNVYECVQVKREITGHSSRGKTWIDEQTLRQDIMKQLLASQTKPIDPEVQDENRNDMNTPRRIQTTSGVKRSSPPPPASIDLTIRHDSIITAVPIDLTQHDDEEADAQAERRAASNPNAPDIEILSRPTTLMTNPRRVIDLA